MLTSTKTYHAKVRPGKYGGYTILIQQLCYVFWIFKLWDTVKTCDCTTAHQVGEYIAHVEARLGKMDIVDSDNIILI